MKIEKKSHAKQLKALFKKKRKLVREVQNTSDFKEPVLILMKRNQKAEFYENATQGEFIYDHSDGTERKILLNTKYLQTFPYGKKTFKGYICHEDFPLPLPAEPDITAETVGLVIDKTLNDIRKWKAEEWKAKGQFYWQIAMGIVAIIGIYIIYKLLFPATPTGAGQAVTQTIVQNLSTIADKTPTIIGG